LIAERRVEVHRLRAQGLLQREIAERIGVKPGVVLTDLRAPAPDPSAVRETGPAERVFTRDQTMQPITIRARAAMIDAGLEPITLHECRHAYASFLIAAGANAKTISGMMGHANISTTFDIYGHLMPGAEDEAASLLDTYLQHARDAGGDDLTAELAEITDTDE
jgi:integrase